MKAILLAGGRGTRLAPYTTILPKPLMPVGDMPILEIVIRQLKYAGFENITLAVGYLSHLIAAYFGNGSKLGVNLTYSYEETPLGTAGPIGLVKDINDTFLVMNGDVLSTIGLADLLTYHRAHGAIATLVAYTHNVKFDLGVVQSNEDNWLVDYIEKPIYRYNVSAGIYMFEPDILSYIPFGERLDLPELVLKVARENKKVSVYKFEGYWLDIGLLKDYEIADEEFRTNRTKFLPEDEK
jgi:NDP-mannose synthase